MKENIKYHKKKFSSNLFIAAVILGFHGLYVYYSTEIKNPVLLISAVLYGLIKMFLFVAPLPADSGAPVSYELAKWLAPILTSALVLTGFTNLLFHSKNRLLNGFTRKHIIIFEISDEMDALIGDLTGRGYGISLVCKRPTASEIKLQYEKRRVAVYFMDFDNAEPKETEYFLKSININSAMAVIIASNDELFNYSLFSRLTKFVKPKNEMKCYIQSDSKSMALYLEELLGVEKAKTPALSKLDLVSFNRNELMIRLFMESAPDILRERFKKSEALDMCSKTGVGDIEAAVGNLFFLVIGVNELLLQMLPAIANDLVISLNEKIKITVVDRHAEEKLENFIFNNDELMNNSIELDTVSGEVRHRSFNLFLKKLRNKEIPAAILFFTEDMVSSLAALNAADIYFKDVPKFLQNTSNDDLNAMLSNNYSKVSFFGDLKKIMNESIFLGLTLDNRAKKFNRSYNYALSMSGNGSGNSWEKLSLTKKNSSRASASHARIKEEILRMLYRDRTESELREMLDMYLEEYRTFELENEANRDGFKDNFRKFLNKYPALDFLTRLEHKRWCNSYYAMNYSYGEIKNERKRTHPCLINEWDRVIGDAFDICHPEYDLIAVFSLFSKDTSEVSTDER